MRKFMLALLVAMLAAIIAACGGTPGSDGGGGAETAATVETSAADADNPFAKYGDITLRVASADNQDPGPKRLQGFLRLHQGDSAADGER